MRDSERPSLPKCSKAEASSKNRPPSGEGALDTRPDHSPRESMHTTSVSELPVKSYKTIARAATESASDRDGYCRPDDPTKFFRVGRIFCVPAEDQNEKASDRATQITASWIYGPQGERSSPRERKLVVVRNAETHCVAIPILTYEGRGVGKVGVTKSDHAIIYTGNTVPTPFPSEQSDRGEMPMRPTAIHARSKDLMEKLHQAARLNFMRPYTIEHDNKVKEWGSVSKESLHTLETLFVAVMSGAPSEASAPVSIDSDASTVRPLHERNSESTMSSRKAAFKSAELPTRILTDTGVATRMARSPAEDITDPALLARGMTAHAMFLGHDPRLYPNFHPQEQPQTFFKTGRVFSILLDESAGSSVYSVSQFEMSAIVGKDGLPKSCRMRRFVVVSEQVEYCSALPIITYDRQGVGRAGVIKEEHGIIYTGSNPPARLDSEKPKRGEQPMQPNPLHVKPDSPADQLDPKSRIHYKRIYTVRHNVPVKLFGRLTKDSIPRLQNQFNNVWGDREHFTAEEDTIRALSESSSSGSLIGLASSA